MRRTDYPEARLSRHGADTVMLCLWVFAVEAQDVRLLEVRAAQLRLRRACFAT